MNTYKRFMPGMVLAGMVLLGLPIPHATARGGIEIGVLTCNSVEGTRRNLLIHSTVDVRCVFKTAEGQETYTGETGIGLGVDLNTLQLRGADGPVVHDRTLRVSGVCRLSAWPARFRPRSSCGYR